MTAAVPKVRSTFVPVAALIAAIVSFQYGATLAKALFPVAGAEGTTTLRLVFGAIFLAAVMRPWRVELTRGTIPSLIGYGASLAAMNLLFYSALRTIPLGIAVALEFSGPMLLAVLASRRASDFAWIVLAVAGLLLLSPLHASHPLDPAGVLYALGAGGCWVLYILFGQKAGRVLGPRATAFGMAIAAILILPVGLHHAGTSLVRPSILLTAAAVGLFSGALPFSLEMMALTGLSARVYGTLTSLEPAVGALMGLALLHEVLDAQQWAGIAIVVAAAAGATLTSRAPPMHPELPLPEHDTDP